MRPQSSKWADAMVLAESQHGVISRPQLLAIGVAARTIQHWRARGWLHDLHAGVYAWGHRAVSWQGRCIAALLAGGERAAISHASAAAIHGLLKPRPTIDVAAPRRRGGDATLRVHRWALPEDDITEKEGVRVTTVERTLFDLCDARLVTEAIAKRLTTLAALNDLIDRKRGRPGAKRFAHVIGVPQYRSKFERLFHRWLQRRGFPEPKVNDKVGRRTFDFVWWDHRVIVETDGPHHRTAQQRQDDGRARHEAARHGFRLIRVPEEGFATREDQVTAQIWAAFSATYDPRL